MATPKQIAANRKNAQKGGRPPGKPTQQKLEVMAVRERIKQRTLGVADLLFESQLSLARGAQYLFRIDKEFVKTGTGKGGEQKGYYRNKKPVLVTSPEEMRQYLEDEITNGDAHDEFDEAASYYFLVARDPQNQAIEAMQDRGLGKVGQTLDITVTPKPIYGGQSTPALAEAKKVLNPKKVKATVIHENGTRTLAEVEE